jgi:membrane protein YqaA with SNARE-associated domain
VRWRLAVSLPAEASLTGLFASSFLAATLLPGGSEVVLYAVLAHDPSLYAPALAVATVANTLGGLTSYLLGRVLPAASLPGVAGGARPRAMKWVRRHGSPALVLAWVPVVGDALCVAAGWVRLRPLPVTAFMALGKFLRYWVIAQSAVA